MTVYKTVQEAIEDEYRTSLVIIKKIMDQIIAVKAPEVTGDSDEEFARKSQALVDSISTEDILDFLSAVAGLVKIGSRLNREVRLRPDLEETMARVEKATNETYTIIGHPKEREKQVG